MRFHFFHEQEGRTFSHRLILGDCRICSVLRSICANEADYEMLKTSVVELGGPQCACMPVHSDVVSKGIVNRLIMETQGHNVYLPGDVRAALALSEEIGLRAETKTLIVPSKEVVPLQHYHNSGFVVGAQKEEDMEPVPWTEPFYFVGVEPYEVGQGVKGIKVRKRESTVVVANLFQANKNWGSIRIISRESFKLHGYVRKQSWRDFEVWELKKSAKTNTLVTSISNYKGTAGFDLCQRYPGTWKTSEQPDYGPYKRGFLKKNHPGLLDGLNKWKDSSTGFTIISDFPGVTKKIFTYLNDKWVKTVVYKVTLVEMTLRVQPCSVCKIWNKRGVFPLSEIIKNVCGFDHVIYHSEGITVSHRDQFLVYEELESKDSDHWVSFMNGESAFSLASEEGDDTSSRSSELGGGSLSLET